MNMKEQIINDIENNPVILYMKGTKQMPMCGFSSQVVQILNSFKIEYKTFDVLSDEGLRSGIKEFSNWPTLPQLYINGEFVGGCDICVEMFENGELAKKLND